MPAAISARLIELRQVGGMSRLSATWRRLRARASWRLAGREVRPAAVDGAALGPLVLALSLLLRLSHGG